MENEAKKQKKKRKYALVWWFMMSLMLAVLIFCGIGVVSSMTEYTKADAEYEKLREVVRKAEETREGTRAGGQSSIEVLDNRGDQSNGSSRGNIGGQDNADGENDSKDQDNKKASTDEQKASPGYPFGSENQAEINQVMFENLRSINEDICGWIRIDGTEIDYPVMHGETNHTYLRTSYTGAYSIAGSIFMDAANMPDFSDLHTILYGHNMADGTMFKGLYHYQDWAFWEQHPYIVIDLPDRRLVYEVFSAYTTVYWDTMYDEQYEAGPDQLDFLQRLLAASEYQVDVPLQEDDRIITLSTCNGGTGTEYRYVVQAVLRQTLP